MTDDPPAGARLECGCYAVAQAVTNRFGGATTRWIKCAEHRTPAKWPDDHSRAEHLADARHAIAKAAERSDNSVMPDPELPDLEPDPDLEDVEVRVHLLYDDDDLGDRVTEDER